MLAVRLSVLFLIALSYIVSCDSAVICYYGTWATYRTGNGTFNVDNIDPFLCTHLMYAFAGIDANGTIISLDPYLDLTDDGGRGNFAKFTALKEKNSNLKTLLSVGGWNEGSAKYSNMTASSELRSNFINSAVQMLTNYSFDGIDFDWEYPNQRDSVYGTEDIENFSIFLQELRTKFDEYGYLITAAVAAVNASASQSYDVANISQYLDYVNIMTYDMYGVWDGVTGHNAPLHKGEGDEDAVESSLNTVENALNYWITAGCPLEKIAVGVPFYGRTYILSNASDTEVKAPISGVGIAGPYTATNGTIGYNEFCYLLKTENWTQKYDSLAEVPYAYQGSNWVSFDNVTSITAKVNYAKELGIQNIMIWSIETDDFLGACGNGNNTMLNAINLALGTGLGTIEPPVADSNSTSSSC